jgi:hypothetical protein
VNINPLLFIYKTVASNIYQSKSNKNILKKKEYFYYDKKHKKWSEKRAENSYDIKQKILSFLAKNKYLKKKLNAIDRHTELKNDRENHLFRNYYTDKIISKNQPKHYKKLKLTYISFFEVIEIDKFDQFKKSLISKFSSKHSGFGKEIRFKDNLIEKLSKIKINLDSSGFGKLINLDFKKINDNRSDYIDFLRISYIKTNESYFMLHIEVKPSEKFKKIATDILKSSETSLSTRHFHSFKNIIKHKLFTSYTSFKSSLIRENVDNLISDLQFQVNHNILKPLNGYFFTSKLTTQIPKIEHFTIKKLKKHKDENNFYSFFNFSSIVEFSSKDELVDIYINNEKNTIHIIKEEEHGKKDITGKDHTDYDWLESYHLIQSLAFPCVFNSILIQEFSKLNHIKRKMYDFLENSSRWQFYKYFLLFHQNNKYLKLKKEITKLNLITNRYKNEFNDRALNFLINHSIDISEYNYSIKNRRKVNESNLSDYYIVKFRNDIKYLTKKKDDINIVFKNIEELNSYRTNFILQIVSLIVGILAFIFAFEKVREFIISLVNE